MKILEINKFHFVKSGADRHFLDLIKLLRSKGHEVAVFAMDHPKNEFSPWSKYFVSYVGYGEKDSLYHKAKGVFRMFYSLEARNKVNKLLDDFKPEIVHINNIYHQISPSILSAIKKRGIPVVMTVHDYKIVCPNYLLQFNGTDTSSVSWKGFIRNKFFKNSYLKSALVTAESRLHRYLNLYDKNIDLYISPSVFTKNILVSHGISSEKIIIQPHFAMSRQYCDLSGPKTTRPYALYYGRISKDKDIEKLIRMFLAMPDIDLYLAGEIEDKIAIPRNQNIKHLGFLSGSQLEQLIQHSSFVVSFSRLPETFGLVALEAMQLGKPFLGFRGSAFDEIVENKKEGFLASDEAEMRKNILHISSDRGLQILFSRNALAKARYFSDEAFFQNIDTLFKALLKNKKALTFSTRDAKLSSHLEMGVLSKKL